MTIRAKMRCSYINRTYNSDKELTAEDVHMNAVYSADKESENYSFSKATPSANVSMHIENPDAFGAFESQKEYYLDFTPVEHGA